MKDYDLITLGEAMLRLSPLGYERISGVKNTIPGNLAEIEGIIRNHNATGYVSELNR